MLRHNVFAALGAMPGEDNRPTQSPSDGTLLAARYVRASGEKLIASLHPQKSRVETIGICHGVRGKFPIHIQKEQLRLFYM